MQPTLTDVETLARQAGEILRAGHHPRPGTRQSHLIHYKGEIDLVTEYDHRSEAYILGEIRRRFPDHRILSEESGELAGGDCCVWYVDPLDGTVNYAHGLALFCVSIAYEENGSLRYGVVYDPVADECYTAERGAGAWLNGETIRVSKAAELDKSLLVTGFPYDVRTNPLNNLDHYVTFTMRSQAVRRLGSAALDLAYVAAGRLDGFWEISIHAWDIAAGGLIAQEAGALVTDIHGDPDFLKPPQSVLSANPAIHAQMLRVFKGEE
jgi:myo-inositol-1(or 4)-monophosphatase